MTDKTKMRMYCAATNAAEMIRSHVETGVEPEDVNEEDLDGIAEYSKACEKISKQIEKLAAKYYKPNKK